MFDLYFIQTIANAITHVACYVLIVTTTGSLKARVAHAVGDDTAYRAGLAAWDPIMHIDWVGLFILHIGYWLGSRGSDKSI